MILPGLTPVLPGTTEAIGAPRPGRPAPSAPNANTGSFGQLLAALLPGAAPVDTGLPTPASSTAPETPTLIVESHPEAPAAGEHERTDASPAEALGLALRITTCAETSARSASAPAPLAHSPASATPTRITSSASTPAGASPSHPVATSAPAGASRSHPVSTPAVAGSTPAASASPVERSASVRSANRSVEALHPEFRKRLDRVVERMEQEFGHTVSITETVRSQARQDFLYEQGRSRPGPIVTWTRNSNHKSGLAVDVIIDGSYGNPPAYERLARIAAEEGLRTLGPMDAGHVEMPRATAQALGIPTTPAGDAPHNHGTPELAPSTPLTQTDPALSAAIAGYTPQGSGPTDSSRSSRPDTPARVARVARVSDVAQVAQVAQVAPVAQVAQVAAVGSPRRSHPAITASDSAAPSTREARSVERSLSPEGILDRPDFSRFDTATSGRNESVQGAGGAEVVDRIARILEMKDAARPSALNQVILRLDNGSGGEDRIRIGLSGQTRIDLARPADAEALATRLPELRQMLEKHGLDPDALQIRTTTLGRDALDPTRIHSLAEVVRPSARQDFGSDGSPRRPPSEDPATSRDGGESHSRSRKEHNGGANS